MSDKLKLEHARKAGDSSLGLWRARSEIGARCRTDAAAFQSIDDLKAALRKSIAERAQMSDQERQTEVWEIQKLAAQGDIAAQNDLGHYWLRKSAEQGYDEACWSLAEFLRSASSPHDPETA
jgi:hypothetical protein